MVLRKTAFIVFGFMLCLSGCGYGLYVVKVDPEKKSTTPVQMEENMDLATQYYATSTSAEAVNLAHSDIERKAIYVQEAVKTLKHFCLIANDIQDTRDFDRRKELGREANNYIRTYIEPVLNDAEARDSMETKAGITELHLLSACIYYQLSGYYQARYYLEQLTSRFEPEFVSGITTDPDCTGFNTIGEGADHLKKMIAMKLATQKGESY